ncbi:CotY/CotZ family spore coat protein [Virgibacillus sp. MG-45]|uniref:CotY/CotZ family spore coat protein n=1 Tax=Virgibacillus sp. MG-45 TaxID=3102791 RepID=UPI002ED7E640
MREEELNELESSQLENEKYEKQEHHKEDEQKEKGKECHCHPCICELLLDIVNKQRGISLHGEQLCSLRQVNKRLMQNTVPIMLQTPYGNPFYTWGNIGSEDCFVTVFFKVVKVDCKKNCAVLQLLKPNISLIDEETDCVEDARICEVDAVTKTKECILVDLSCYSAVKCLSVDLVVEGDC